MKKRFFLSKVYQPFTAPVTIPSIKYLWKHRKITRIGIIPNIEPAIKHGDKIFLTFSGSGTDALYCVGLLYADADADLLDPTSWTKVPYPVFQSSTATGQFGLGHNSFTKSDDDSEDFIIYHGRQEARYLVEEDYQPLYDAGRNATVGKIYWNKEGFPDFSVPSASIAGTPEALQVAAKVTVI